MKKNLLIAVLAVTMGFAAAAQETKKDEPPKPPKPPKPLIEKQMDAPPPPPPPGEPPPPPAPPVHSDEAMQFPEDYEAFLKLNPSVKSLRWNRQDEVIITLKSGKEEKYSLSNEVSRKAAIAKYGELPASPPPPPPLPPPAPEPPKRKSGRTLS